MKQRRYSIDEIDGMRRAVEQLAWGAKDVEERLRTYMLNGTDPEELIDAGLKAEIARVERVLKCLS